MHFIIILVYKFSVYGHATPCWPAKSQVKDICIYKDIYIYIRDAWMCGWVSI